MSHDDLLQLIEELEYKAGFLHGLAEATEHEAHIHMERNIDDMDYLLPKASRDGRNKAMTEMFSATCDAQKAARNLVEAVSRIREKQSKMPVAMTADGPDDGLISKQAHEVYGNKSITTAEAIESLHKEAKC